MLNQINRKENNKDDKLNKRTNDNPDDIITILENSKKVKEIRADRVHENTLRENMYMIIYKPDKTPYKYIISKDKK